MLQLRISPSSRSNRGLLLPAMLLIVSAQDAQSLPGLVAELPTPAMQAYSLLLQVHNSAGIPIISASSSLSLGEQRVIFSDLSPIGIEAYAHKPAAERSQIAQRIWTRRSYAMIVIQDAHQ
jgi:hypothetical protein